MITFQLLVVLLVVGLAIYAYVKERSITAAAFLIFLVLYLLTPFLRPIAR